MNTTTHTLIIGGGFAGATLAQELAKSNIATMLIDRKDYFEVTMAILRNVADLKDLKLAAAAIPQGKKLAVNLIAKQQGKKTKAHKPMPEMGLIPIGPKKGVAQIPIFGTVTWKPLIDFKNKDLLIGYVLKRLGIK